MRPILYIHGFASSGYSTKAERLKARLPRVFAPSLSHIPQLAIQTLEEWIDALGKPLLVGSSLGGYYALHLCAEHRLPVVLVNPALRPLRTLGSLTGLMHHYYDGSQFQLTASHLDYLETLAVPHPPLDRLLLLVQLGDEVIDQRETVRLLAGTRMVVEEGGDHGFQNFDSVIPAIEAFAAG